MTTAVLLVLWAVLLLPAAASRFGARREGLAPVQHWISTHRLTYSAGVGALFGACAALAAANPWFALVGVGAAVVVRAAIPRAEARLRRRHA